MIWAGDRRVLLPECTSRLVAPLTHPRLSRKPSKQVEQTQRFMSTVVQPRPKLRSAFIQRGLRRAAVEQALLAEHGPDCGCSLGHIHVHLPANVRPEGLEDECVPSLDNGSRTGHAGQARSQ